MNIKRKNDISIIIFTFVMFFSFNIKTVFDKLGCCEKNSQLLEEEQKDSEDQKESFLFSTLKYTEIVYPKIKFNLNIIYQYRPEYIRLL